MDTKTSETLTILQIRTLRDALQHYYGGLLGLPDAKDVDGQWFEWKNKKQFLDEISEIFGIDVSPESINRDLADKIYVELTNLENTAPKTIEFKEADASPVNATLPDEITQQKLNEDAERIIEAKNKINDNEILKVRKSIEQQEGQVEINKQTTEKPKVVIGQENISDEEKSSDEVVEEQPKEETSFVPVYIGATPQLQKSDEQKISEVKNAITKELSKEDTHLSEQLGQIRDSINTKKAAFANEIKETEALSAKLNENDTKVWVRVTPADLSPEVKALQVRAVANPRGFVEGVAAVHEASGLSKGNSNMVALKTAEILSNDLSADTAIAFKIVNTPSILSAIADNPQQQSKIDRVVKRRLTQSQIYNQYFNSKKILGPKVEISEVYKEDFTEVVAGQIITNELLKPDIQSLNDQVNLLTNFDNGLQNNPTNGAESTFNTSLNMSVGQRIASLPSSNNTLAASGSPISELILLEAGLSPSSFTTDGSIQNFFLASSGLENSATVLQGTTGETFELVSNTSAIVLPNLSAKETALLNKSYSTNPLKAVKTGISSMFADMLSKISVSLKKMESKQGLMVIGGALAAVAGAASGASVLTFLGGSTAFVGFAINPANVFSGAAFTSILAPIAGLASALFGAIITSIVLPIIIGILCVPLLVGLFLFIINSGAYVVPHGIDINSPVSNRNPYIGITKVANPPGPFQNSDLPLKITYTVTITAKQQPLTNVFVKDDCTVITKAGTLPCTATAIQPPGNTISAGYPFTFTYDANYNSTYKDSIVSNVVTVTANVASQTATQTAVASATIMIGSLCGSTNATTPMAVAAQCIVVYLNQFHLNPLLAGMVDNSNWQSLANILPTPAMNALRDSAPVDGHLQCIGFVSATAGLAYGQNWGQLSNACSYVNNAPQGYQYFAGTAGIRSGDIFVIRKSGGCSSGSPGHIGVVISVDGALISCADANYTSDGFARVAHGCFALTQITGYIRKQ